MKNRENHACMRKWSLGSEAVGEETAGEGDEAEAASIGIE